MQYSEFMRVVEEYEYEKMICAENVLGVQITYTNKSGKTNTFIINNITTKSLPGCIEADCYTLYGDDFPGSDYRGGRVTSRRTFSVASISKAQMM